MFIAYACIRLITFPLSVLPYSVLHGLGKLLGTWAYHLISKFRKRAESNLALAKDLNLTHEQIKTIAKKSIQSVMITCLEYPKLAREKDITKIATCENPEEAATLLKNGTGVIFFCGHQANWELLFLEGTSRMPGLAIGRPIKNRYLYNWVLAIRQKFGGTIVPRENAIKEGLRALKRGAFLGIVGDQGMPDSGFSSPFLGRLAWTSPMPALLAYKTNTPIIVATTVRTEESHYKITYSKPLFPNLTNTKEEEVRRLMTQALDLYQESIKAHPEQWLWIHNRWKQQTLDKIKRPFRQDSLALFLPEDTELIESLKVIRDLYPTEHITFFVPQTLQHLVAVEGDICPYTNLKETIRNDLRFKLIVNFTADKMINQHYKKTAAITAHFPTIEAFKNEVLRA